MHNYRFAAEDELDDLDYEEDQVDLESDIGDYGVDDDDDESEGSRPAVVEKPRSQPAAQPQPIAAIPPVAPEPPAQEAMPDKKPALKASKSVSKPAPAPA